VKHQPRIKAGVNLHGGQDRKKKKGKAIPVTGHKGPQA
jgi:hypothetical protein